LDYCQYSGQGGAVETFGEVKIAVFLVVNALGAIYNEQGKMVHGYVDPKTGKPLSPNELFHQFYPFSAPKASGQKGDTTLTVVIINMDLEMDEMGQIARQVHNSIAQVIRPFGTSEDGDTLYFVSTKERQLPTEDRENTIPRLGMLATRVAKKAIYSIFKPGA
jgi:L-aminopeptidase/D-esterase-like protein